MAPWPGTNARLRETRLTMTEPPAQNQDNARPTDQVDLSRYRNIHSLGNRLMRGLWGLVWCLLFRTSPKLCHTWRLWLLRLFGAKIGKGCHVYSSCRIWAPWNLTMGDHSCLSFGVDCYCVDKVTIGSNVTVSQYSRLCTASHDYTYPDMRLIHAPITVRNQAWICADVFVGMGVTIGQGAVAAARAMVTKDVDPWAVVAGNPAKQVKQRQLRQPDQKPD